MTETQWVRWLVRVLLLCFFFFFLIFSVVFWKSFSFRARYWLDLSRPVIAQWDIVGSGEGEGVGTDSHNLECLLVSFNRWEEVAATCMTKVKFPRGFHFCHQFALRCTCEDHHIIIKIIDWILFSPFPFPPCIIFEYQRKSPYPPYPPNTTPGRKEMYVSTIFMKQSVLTPSVCSVLQRVTSTATFPGRSLVTWA